MPRTFFGYSGSGVFFFHVRRFPAISSSQLLLLHRDGLGWGQQKALGSHRRRRRQRSWRLIRREMGGRARGHACTPQPRSPRAVAVLPSVTVKHHHLGGDNYNHAATVLRVAGLAAAAAAQHQDVRCSVGCKDIFCCCSSTH